MAVHGLYFNIFLNIMLGTSVFSYYHKSECKEIAYER